MTVIVKTWLQLRVCQISLSVGSLLANLSKFYKELFNVKCIFFILNIICKISKKCNKKLQSLLSLHSSTESESAYMCRCGPTSRSISPRGHFHHFRFFGVDSYSLNIDENFALLKFREKFKTLKSVNFKILLLLGPGRRSELCWEGSRAENVAYRNSRYLFVNFVFYFSFV